MGFFKDKAPLKPTPARKIVPAMTLNGVNFQMNDQGVWTQNGGAPSAHQTQHIQMLEVRLQAADKLLQQEREKNAMLMRQMELMKKSANPGSVPVSMPVSMPMSDDQELVVAHLKATVSDLKADLVTLQKHLDEADYRNRVLLAMCTISECDYIELCNEAGIDPREVNVKYEPPSARRKSPVQSRPQSSNSHFNSAYIEPYRR